MHVTYVKKKMLIFSSSEFHFVNVGVSFESFCFNKPDYPG